MMLPTTNPAYGFYGTAKHFTDPDQAWALMVTTIGERTLENPETIRDFLDSTAGRHLADEVNNLLTQTKHLDDAIEQAVNNEMDRLMSDTEARTFGLPKGLPQLVGSLIVQRPEGAGTEPNLDPTDLFIDDVSNVKQILKRLAALSDEHFGVSPDAVSWAHIKQLKTLKKTLSGLLNPT